MPDKKAKIKEVAHLTEVGKQYGLIEQDIADNEFCPMQFWEKDKCPFADKEKPIVDKDCAACWNRSITIREKEVK